MPKEISEFFARYALAVSLGTFVYFAVTILVETGCAVRWVNRNATGLPSGQVWRGVLWANLATYAVMAPLHYFVTRPGSDIHNYTHNVNWTQHRQMRLLFIDPPTGNLKTKLIGDGQAETVVAAPVKAFLVSTNLKTCIYQGGDGLLYAWRREPASRRLIGPAGEYSSMDYVAFSPSGSNVVAALGTDGRFVDLFQPDFDKHVQLELKTPFTNAPRVAWTMDENRFVVAGHTNEQRWAVTIHGDGTTEMAPLDAAAPVPLLPCYMLEHWDWGSDRDECGDLGASAFPGLGSSLF